MKRIILFFTFFGLFITTQLVDARSNEDCSKLEKEFNEKLERYILQRPDRYSAVKNIYSKHFKSVCNRDLVIKNEENSNNILNEKCQKLEKSYNEKLKEYALKRGPRKYPSFKDKYLKKYQKKCNKELVIENPEFIDEILKNFCSKLEKDTVDDLKDTFNKYPNLEKIKKKFDSENKKYKKKCDGELEIEELNIDFENIGILDVSGDIVKNINSTLSEVSWNIENNSQKKEISALGFEILYYTNLVSSVEISKDSSLQCVIGKDRKHDDKSRILDIICPSGINSNENKDLKLDIVHKNLEESKGLNYYLFNTIKYRIGAGRELQVKDTVIF